MGSNWRRMFAMIALLPIWALSFLVPRRKDLWVLGTWDGLTYTDNTRHLHAWISANRKPGIRAVWITRNLELAEELRDLGGDAASLYSVRGIWLCLRAGTYIFTHTVDDICLWLSGRAFRVNLWHGVPLKKINFDNRFDRYRNARGLKRLANWPHRLKRLVKPHRIVVSSDSQVPVFSGAFRIDPERVLPLGYPRNDRLVDPGFPSLLLSIESRWLDRLHGLKAQGRRIVLYMPTFRRNENPGQYQKALNADELDQHLSQLDAHLLIKAHPMSTDFTSFEQNGHDRIDCMPTGMDPYLILALADILLTDYSSIFYDYLLLDRPIIFYPFDIEHYQKMERELYFDYDRYVPGPVVGTPQEMLDQIQRALRLEDGYQARRKELLTEIFDTNGGNSCGRIVSDIVATIGAEPTARV